MNIVLADVQPSSINLSEPVAESDLGDGKFSNLMDQQMNQTENPSVTVENTQAVDIKELNINPEAISALQSELVAESEAPQAWLEFLANQQLNVTAGTNTEPVTVDIVESDITSLSEESADLTEVPPNAINLALGELLPGSGKALPSVESQASTPATVTAIQAPTVQNDLLRQVKSLDSRPIEQAVVESANLKSADLRIVEPLSGSKSFEIPTPLKTDPTAEALNQFKVPEFQAINNAISEQGDAANSNIRTLGPSLAMANAVTQPASQLLPTQLETLTVNNTRNTQAWGNGIGERVHYMINQKLNTATIRLDPPMLGRLEVHIQVNDDITNVTINTQHAQTRELIDNASFRLREFLQENGYQNVNVDVSQEQEQQQASNEADDGQANAAEDGLSEQANEAIVDGQGNQYFSSNSVVDYFA